MTQACQPWGRVLTGLVFLLLTSALSAQSALPATGAGLATADSLSYDFRGVNLVGAIERLVRDVGLNVGYDPSDLKNVTCDCVIEDANLEGVLTCVLHSTGFEFQKTSSGVYVIARSRTDASPGLGGSEPSGPERFTLSGFVRDARSGEAFIGAHIYEQGMRAGTASNLYGFYSLTLPADTVTLHFSYLGYEPKILHFYLSGDLQLNVRLEPIVIESGGVEVVAEREDRVEDLSRMSSMSIPIRQVRAMPVVLGEIDVLRSLQLLPGVTSGTEGSSGLYVRGGSPDQTLILLDGARVYNASHVFGLFSVFNGDAVKHVELVKGGFPARYGGRLSSVLEIGMKEGNNKQMTGEAAIGAVASRLMIEGPLVKDKASFILSGRRTYIDALMEPFMPDDERVGFFFYDLNAKVNYQVRQGDRLFLSLYRGKDRYSAEDKSTSDPANVHMQWGNLTSTARWNHVVNSRLFSNVTGTFSKYQFDIGVEEGARFSTDEAFKLQYMSGITDWGLKADVDYLPSPDHFARMGLEGRYHAFRPGATIVKVSLDDEGSNGDLKLDPAEEIRGFEYTGYVEDDFRVDDRLKINAGLHASGFLVQGTHFKSLEPRLSARYLLPRGLALKASYARMKQYILLLTNSSIGLPTDLWLPATPRVPPQSSDQLAVGFARSIGDYEASLEGYYKWMNRLIEFKEGASFLGIDKDWQNKVESGSGRSRGVEVLIQRKRGRTTGWLAYTLSWTDRRFENLNLGRNFPYKYDHRHDFAVVMIHRISSRLEISGNWVYSTGSAVTIPTTSYRYHPFVDIPACFNCTIDAFDERNGYRQAPNHRLDVAINYSPTRSGKQMLTAGIYNVYNRKNPFFVWIREDDGALVQFSLLPVLPYVTYRRSF